ncbi:hypothetical protein ACVBE9_09485 [Eionea flava]
MPISTDDTYRLLQQHIANCLGNPLTDQAITLLITKRLPLLEAFFGGASDPAKKTINFVHDYIALVPHYFSALNALSEMDNIQAYTTPFLDDAIQFFSMEEATDNTMSHRSDDNIVDLLSQAYSFHRMIEELNDRVALERQLPLAPIDMAYTNLIAHTIIGDEEANLLDQNVLIKLEITSATLADTAEVIFQNPSTQALTEQRRDRGWQDVYEKYEFFAKDIT